MNVINVCCVINSNHLVDKMSPYLGNDNWSKNYNDCVVLMSLKNGTHMKEIKVMMYLSRKHGFMIKKLGRQNMNMIKSDEHVVCVVTPVYAVVKWNEKIMMKIIIIHYIVQRKCWIHTLCLV